MGGVARRAALLKALEKKTKCTLLDAGDIFQGTPYFITTVVN
jgi:2',3'-cyclic-nucleotide 2'-phosphodiesterase (5'-nucleotidase family)